MSNFDKTFILVVIFCIIFFSYIFVQFFVYVQETKNSATHNKIKNLPFLFSATYWLLPFFTESIGKCYRRYCINSYLKIQKQLMVADIRIPAEFVFIYQVLTAMIAGMLIFFLTVFIFADIYIGLAGSFLVAFCGYFYPQNIIANLAQKRQTAMIRSLPFAIDLIASAMRSGLDFSAAIRYYVANERKDSPLTQEFSVTLRDMELGKTRVEALEAMAKKIQIKDFTSFVSAVIHGTEVGASIVETLKIQGEEMRRVRFNIAERKAARAPSIMILPIALFIMPAFFMVIAAPIFIRLQTTGGLGGLLK